MLFDRMQTGFTATFVKGLMVLIIISFIFWGAEGLFKPSSSQAVAIVGEQQIARSLYERMYRQELDRLRPILGSNPEEKAPVAWIRSMILDRLIQQALLKEQVEALSIHVSDKVLMQEVAANPIFQDENKQFNSSLFIRVLKQNNLTADQYKNELKQSISTNFLTNSLTDGLKPLSFIQKQQERYNQEQREVRIWSIPAINASAISAPKDEELTRYYEANKALALVPEKRDIYYVVLKPDQLSNHIVVSEELLAKRYEDQKSELIVPEKRRILNAKYDSELLAKKAVEESRDKGRFLAFAKDHLNIKDEKELLLGDVSIESLPNWLQDPVFNQKSPGVVGPVASDFGWHVVWVDAIIPGKVPTFEEVKGQLAKQEYQHAIEQALVKRVGEWDDELAGGADLIALAQKSSVLVEQKKNVSEQDLKNESLNSHIVTLAFNTPAGETSAITLDQETGHYVVVKVDAVRAAHHQDLASLRARYEHAWRMEEGQRKAKHDIESYLKQQKDQPSLGAIPNHWQLISSNEIMTRHELEKLSQSSLAQDPKKPLLLQKKIPLALKQAIFTVAPKTRTEPIWVEDRFWVAELTNATLTSSAGMPAPSDKDRKEKELESLFSSEIIGLYLSYIESKVGVQHLIDPIEYGRQ
jgi:peptidyl-prolyl cis-trans isomerase D